MPFILIIETPACLAIEWALLPFLGSNDLLIMYELIIIFIILKFVIINSPPSIIILFNGRAKIRLGKARLR